MDLPKEFLSRHRLLGAFSFLRVVPVSGGVCAGAGCPDRFRFWTIHPRSGTDISHALSWHGDDDYLHETAANRIAASKTQIPSAIGARLTLLRQHVLMRG